MLVPYSWFQILWYFYIYGFLGWCSEVAFAAVAHGKFVNRGFVNGPICSIYGFGTLLRKLRALFLHTGVNLHAAVLRV